MLEPTNTGSGESVLLTDRSARACTWCLSWSRDPGWCRASARWSWWCLAVLLIVAPSAVAALTLTTSVSLCSPLPRGSRYSPWRCPCRLPAAGSTQSWGRWLASAKRTSVRRNGVGQGHVGGRDLAAVRYRDRVSQIAAGADRIGAIDLRYQEIGMRRLNGGWVVALSLSGLASAVVRLWILAMLVITLASCALASTVTITVNAAVAPAANEEMSASSWLNNTSGGLIENVVP